MEEQEFKERFITRFSELIDPETAEIEWNNFNFDPDIDEDPEGAVSEVLSDWDWEDSADLPLIV